MAVPLEQAEALKGYCDRVGVQTEGGVTFYLLERLRLPTGCNPPSCDGLLCPTQREGYPSRLYFSVRVSSPYDRNWNVSDARICERNWFAFSWKVESTPTTLVEILLAHLNGFVKEK